MRRPPSERELRQAPLPALPRSALPSARFCLACSACSGWRPLPALLLLQCLLLLGSRLAWACLGLGLLRFENSELGFESLLENKSPEWQPPSQTAASSKQPAASSQHAKMPSSQHQHAMPARQRVKCVETRSPRGVHRSMRLMFLALSA